MERDPKTMNADETDAFYRGNLDHWRKRANDDAKALKKSEERCELLEGKIRGLRKDVFEDRESLTVQLNHARGELAAVKVSRDFLNGRLEILESQDHDAVAFERGRANRLQSKLNDIRKLTE